VPRAAGVILRRFDLFGEVGATQTLVDRGQDGAVDDRRRQGSANRIARQDRRFVQQLQGVAEQDLGLQVGPAVGRQQVVQVEGEERVADAVAAGVARGQGGIAPGDIWRDLMQEEIELRRIVVVEGDRIRRHAGDGDAGAEDVGNRLIDHPGVEQILDDGRDTGNGQGVAHGRPPLRRAR
jgi:hypothetical protein